MRHQEFNRNFTKLQEYFLYVKKTKIMTLFNNSSPPCHHSAILKSIHWTQTAYAVLCQLHHTDTLFSFISKRMICSYQSNGYAVCVQWMLSKMVLRWHGDDELLNKVIIFVFFAYKSILVASKNYSWTPDVTWIILPISLLRLWTWIVLIPLLSEDERRSYGFGTTWGWVINDNIFILGWSNPLI